MANVSIPIYNVSIDDEQIGMTAISFVDEPAIMTDFLAFKKEMTEQKIWMSSHDKREVVSPILIPNQLIYRVNKEGEPYYIRWTPEAIEMAAAKYLANGFWNNFTVMHPLFYDANLTYQDVLEKDVYLLRMWIVKGENDDANTKYGFNLPQGTLMVHLKIHNRQIWSRIKSGELRGLSIEAFTNVIRDNNDVKLDINMQKLDVNSKQLNLFQKFINFMNEVAAEAEDISAVAKKDEAESGDVSLKYFIDEEHYIEVDAEGFARDAEYNLVAEGEYLLADGNYLIVDGSNKFVGTKASGDKDVEEQPIEAPIAESKVEEKKEDEEDKEDVEKSEGEDGGEEKPSDSEPSIEEPSVDDEKSDEDGAEEAPKADEPIEEPIDEPSEEVPTEEEPTAEPPLALAPFEINGVEYMLPQEVIDFINSLKSANEASLSELALMKERIPSAAPIPTVINQNAESDNEIGGLSDAIRMLNFKR